MAPMPRLFFALWPDAPARAALARLALDVAQAAHGRAPRADNLHVTLAFLGSVDDADVARAVAAGMRAAAAAGAFDVALARLGGTRRGIAWCAPAVVPTGLGRLHEALAAALHEAGFATEARSFRPHVTLARDCAGPLRRAPLPAPIGWRADALALVASTPAPGGSHYRDLARWPLAAAQESSA